MSRPLHVSAADHHNNLGNTLNARGEYDSALASYERALSIEPRHPEAHLNRGISLLLRGDLTRGFREYEWRTAVQGDVYPRTSRPRWDGRASLRDKTILLRDEQGFGDTIQFLRYVALITERAPRAIRVECRRELTSLVSRVEGVEKVFARGEASDDDCDCHVPLLSLAKIFGTTLQTIPNQVPYVAPDPARVAKWQPYLAKFARTARLKVGVVWTGNPKHPNNATRSLSLAELEPLAALDGVALFSLQKGDAAMEAPEVSMRMRLVDLSPLLYSFHDTAAVIANLDLVITVDTAVAHLAGAMGKPVWTMLPSVPDWRWMTGGSESRWYPTMWLVRQSRPQEWNDVVERVGRAMKKALTTSAPLAA